MSTRVCLRCGASTIIYGAVLGHMGGPAAFVTRIRQKFWGSVPRAVVDAKQAECCLTCGTVCTTLSPSELRAAIVSESGELGSQYVRSVLLGPYHGLPDIPEARDAAGKVAAIDRQLLAGDRMDAAVSYRDLMGSSWSDACAAVHGWQDLTRREKLARCGWPESDPPSQYSPHVLDHPLRDALLDGP